MRNEKTISFYTIFNWSRVLFPIVKRWLHLRSKMYTRNWLLMQQQSSWNSTIPFWFEHLNNKSRLTNLGSKLDTSSLKNEELNMMHNGVIYQGYTDHLKLTGLRIFYYASSFRCAFWNAFDKRPGCLTLKRQCWVALTTPD